MINHSKFKLVKFVVFSLIMIFSIYIISCSGTIIVDKNSENSNSNSPSGDSGNSDEGDGDSSNSGNEGNNDNGSNSNYSDDSDAEESSSKGDTINNYYLPPEPGEDEYNEILDDIRDTNSGEQYENYGINPPIDTSVENTSTFSVDVDTGSYAIARRFIMDNGRLPPNEAVRVEEFINYFNYNYPIPDKADFAIITDLAPSMFREGKYMLRVGIQGKDVPPAERKRANLMFLIDVSGSMMPKKKLPLVKESLKILLDNLRDDDYIGITVYKGEAEPFLESTPVKEKKKILHAIDKLEARGTTNAEGGIKVAYEMLTENYIENGVNRVILCSDGDANVGNVDPQVLLDIVKDYRTDLGITLSTFGFGMGNYNDVFMEQLANKGDGNYAYIDTIEEAQRVFGEKLLSTIQEIARDVKVQVEFNKDTVKTYRLIGYENRKLDKEDFRDDKVDAGEIGALHSVTAVYELVLHDDYKSKGDLLYEFRIRWKDDKGENVREANTTLSTKQVRKDFYDTSSYYQLALCVSEFGEMLRGSPYAYGFDYEVLIETVISALEEIKNTTGEDADIKFQELLDIITKAETLRYDDYDYGYGYED